MIFEPTYIPYRNRLKTNLIKVLFIAVVYGLMLTLVILKSQENNENTLIFFTSLFIITLVFKFRTDRIYLKSVCFEDKNVKIIFVDKDAEIEYIDIPIEKIEIQIKRKSYFHRNILFGGNNNLEFHEFFKDKYTYKISQIDSQNWNFKNFKSIYDYYLKIKTS